MGQDGDQRPPKSRGARTAAAGGQLVVIFLVGFLGGRWLDGRLHTAPWLTVTGILMGFGIGLLSAYRALTRP